MAASKWANAADANTVPCSVAVNPEQPGPALGRGLRLQIPAIMANLGDVPAARLSFRFELAATLSFQGSGGGSIRPAHSPSIFNTGTAALCFMPLPFYDSRHSCF